MSYLSKLHGKDLVVDEDVQTVDFYENLLLKMVEQQIERLVSDMDENSGTAQDAIDDSKYKTRDVEVSNDR